ncbi:hypothetical protein [Luteimonas aquatica]|uniref:hypothetical protein n=1 Tax=Luteimonas aquatica TaxID=450364 RepID=UPI001F570820|nr:hypothetical protein [Luteimonas aquatica]
MSSRLTPFALLSAPLLLALAGAASADVLLINRVQQEQQLQLPARGTSMGAVQSRFGAPSEKLEPRGGQKRQWPTIHRWVYPGFTVYFENSRVVDAVANKATPNETGPKPAIR